MYLEFYGLEESPFNLTPDTNFLFPSRVHREVLAHLLYGINSRKGFIMLTGEVGSGKTTICRALLAKLGPNTEVALVLNSFLSELELLQAINDDLGIPSTGGTRKELIDQLNDFLLERRIQGKNVVVIIDEAQNLSFSVLEQIRMLSNLETEKEKLLQIALVGQPELRGLLTSPRLKQLNQRITVRHHITPLTKKECVQYVYHRLKVAGSTGNIAFTESALNEVFRFSGGIPRMINVICDQTLLSGYVAGSTRIDRNMVRAAQSEIQGTTKRPGELRQTGFSLSRIGAVVGLALAGLLIVATLFRPLLRGILFPEHTASTVGDSRHTALAEAKGSSPGEGVEGRRDAAPSGDARGSSGKPADSPGEFSPNGPPRRSQEPVPATSLPPPSLMRLASLAGATSRLGRNLSDVLRSDMELLFSPKMAPLTTLPPPPRIKLGKAPPPAMETDRRIVAYRSFAEPTLSLLRQWKRPPAVLQTVRERYNEVGDDISSLAAAAKMGWTTLRADLNMLRMIDMPAIIEVSGEEKQRKGYVTLVGLAETWAEITTASGAKRVDLQLLSQILKGGAVVLCDDPFVSPERLHRGQGISLSVRKLQDYLKTTGYFDGNPSGWFTSATTVAVMAFQKDHGLPVTGEADGATKLLLYTSQSMPQVPRLCKAE